MMAINYTKDDQQIFVINKVLELLKVFKKTGFFQQEYTPPYIIRFSDRELDGVLFCN